MGKVDFKLNDSLLSRRSHHAEDAGELSGTAPRPVEEKLATTATRSVEPPAQPSGVISIQRNLDPGLPTGSPGPDNRPRPRSVQTSVLLPPELWDRLASLANDLGGLHRANRVLTSVLEAHSPADIREAADDLDWFLSLPPEESHVAKLWEERNLRLPFELRMRLDDLRDRLTAAGIAEATRSHLIAAIALRRGPNNAEEAHALMTELRAAAIERATAESTL